MRLTIILTITILIISGCNKGNPTNTTSYKGQGTATIQGRVGFFDAVLPAPGSGLIGCGYPPNGYDLAEYHWITSDTPQTTHWICLGWGRGNYKNHLVEITGAWHEVVETCDVATYSYIQLSIDSIRIIQ
jgi:hypothetical protein